MKCFRRGSAYKFASNDLISFIFQAIQYIHTYMIPDVGEVVSAWSVVELVALVGDASDVDAVTGPAADEPVGGDGSLIAASDVFAFANALLSLLLVPICSCCTCAATWTNLFWRKTLLSYRVKSF